MRYGMSLKSKFFNTFLSIGISLSTAVAGSQEDMLRDLQNIHTTFLTRYAPKEWKEQHCDWNAALQLELATQKITKTSAISIVDYQRIIKDYLRSLKDYHVGCKLTSSEYSYLPFDVRSADGHYFVTRVNPRLLNTKIFKINVGDEVISFNGVPIAEIGEDIRSKIDRGNYDTDVALADRLITDRGRMDGLDTPKGLVDIKLIDKTTQRPKTYHMIWHEYPEYYTFHYHKPREKKSPKLSHPMFVAADWITRPRAIDEDDSKKSDLPRLGKVVWKNDKENIFQAYIFETEQGEHVGFLRIGTFMPESIYQGVNCEFEMNELKEIITRFEESTQKLVLDVTNNGGGSVFYMYGILSLFANEPLKLPTERVIMEPKIIGEFRQSLRYIERVRCEKTAQEYFNDIIDVVEPSYQYVEMYRAFVKTIIAEWESGVKLSSALPFYGFEQINPHSEAVYTKPILLLVNELDFSCADFFPAVMQDNGRAVLMGNRTSGAGGAVFMRKLYSDSGVSHFTYTWTLGERSASGLPIENLGITPDIPYKHTAEDLRNGFKEYKAAILKQLEAL